MNKTQLIPRAVHLGYFILYLKKVRHREVKGRKCDFLVLRTDLWQIFMHVTYL